jgi:hypothetical protein
MAGRDLKLPSGRTLHIQVAPFRPAKALYQAFAEECKTLKMDPESELDANLFKDLLCTALASKKIEGCIWDCFKTVTIDDLKIDDDSFEPVEARDDYFTVCLEVARDNLLPFAKSLLQQYSAVLGKVKSSLVPK